jgi:hypothetical protein
MYLLTRHRLDELLKNITNITKKETTIMTNKEKLLQDLFAANNKAFEAQIAYDMAQWEVERARAAYKAYLEAERQAEAAANE